MKNSIIVSLLIFSFALVGCSGENGKADIAFSWYGKPTAFTDENPATPSSASALIGNYKYTTEAGTFAFSYTAWNGSRYSANYTITLNEGTINPLLLTPMDGEDINYTMYLSSSGPTISDYLKTDESIRYQSSEQTHLVQTTTEKSGTSTAYESIDSEEFVEERIIGETKIILKYKAVNPASN